SPIAPTINRMERALAACKVVPNTYKLSVRISSMKKRPTEYVHTYVRKMTPRNGLYLRNKSNTINIRTFQTDSYKNVGWYITPSIHIWFVIKSGTYCKKLLYAASETGPPCASWFMKFPQRPMACPKIKLGAIISASCQNEILRILVYTMAVNTEPMSAP